MGLSTIIHVLYLNAKKPKVS